MDEGLVAERDEDRHGVTVDQSCTSGSHTLFQILLPPVTSAISVEGHLKYRGLQRNESMLLVRIWGKTALEALTVSLLN
jgi:hypothetical protein